MKSPLTLLSELHHSASVFHDGREPVCLQHFSQEGTNVVTFSSLNKPEVIKVWEELITSVGS